MNAVHAFDSDLLSQNLAAQPSGEFYPYLLKKCHQKRIEIVTSISEKEFCNRNSSASNLKLLSIGCYDGFIEERFIKQGWQVYGIDGAKEALKIAEGKGVRATHSDFTKKLPYPSNSFDYVFAGEVIEHIIDVQLLLQEIRRILKPGGKLLITTPNLARLQDRLRFLVGKSPKHVAPIHPKLYLHIRPFTWESLKKTLLKSGFVNLDFYTNYVSLFLDQKELNIPLLPTLFPSLGRSLIVEATVSKQLNHHPNILSQWKQHSIMNRQN